MSLQLDERRRAMLGAMGLRLFDAAPGPQSDTAPALAPVRRPVAAPQAPAVAAVAAVVSQPVVAKAAPTRDGIELLAWDALADAIAGCRACKLCDGRQNAVVGVGPGRADWMVVGEPPNELEDAQGEPFVGQPGKLLDNMLKALGLDRSRNVYIANVLRCQPPGNRNPEPEELAQCEPFLRRQVQLVQPKVILALGRFAMQSLLGTTDPIGKLRGRPHQYLGVPVVVSYHPAYLLRNQPDKAKAWADLCLARELAQRQTG